LCLEEKREEFTLELANRFQALDIEEVEEDAESTWNKVKAVFHQTGEKVIGRDKRPTPAKWMTGRTWEVIEERRSLHQRILATKSLRIKDQLRRQYAEMNKRVKIRVKEDKRMFYEDRARAAQTAANMGHMREVYKITEELAGKK